MHVALNQHGQGEGEAQVGGSSQVEEIHVGEGSRSLPMEAQEMDVGEGS